MRKLMILLAFLGCVSGVSATKWYYTAQNGDPAAASTWVPGNIPAAPDWADTATRIYINHYLTATSTGNFLVKCYVNISAYGILNFNYQTHINGATCRWDIWGTANIYNVLYMENAATMYIYYGGFVYTNNKIDVLGNGQVESGHIILWGGGICWRTLWKGTYPPEGYGVTCNNPWASSDGCCLSTGPLGVELVSFAVSCNGSQTELSWVTENEENNEYFTIERSRDLIAWEVLSNVPGSLNSHGIIEYKIFDPFPYQGITYYRLSQTDVNGKHTIFGGNWLRYSSCSCENKDYLFPIPSNEFCTFFRQGTESVSFVLSDLFGNQMLKGVFSPGSNQVTLSGFPKGIYSINTTDGGFYKLIIE